MKEKLKRKRRSKERKRRKRKDLPSKVKKKSRPNTSQPTFEKNWQQKIQLIKFQLIKTFMRLRSSKTENKRCKRLSKNWSRKHSA